MQTGVQMKGFGWRALWARGAPRMGRVVRSVLGASVLLGSALLGSVACQSKSNEVEAESANAKQNTREQQAAPANSAPGTAAKINGPKAPAPAEVGRPAPNFELSDLDGKRVRLSDHRGSIVVLEWINPDCPFVQASYRKGSLKGLAERQQKEGVVWIAINSAAPGRQGHGVERNRKAKEQFQVSHAIALDESGEVGRLYGATNTPHMFVIDKQGVLAYAGAIDNSPDGEGESPQGGKLINYVDAAVSALKSGEPVKVPRTEAYGCSVKYRKEQPKGAYGY